MCIQGEGTETARSLVGLFLTRQCGRVRDELWEDAVDSDHSVTIRARCCCLHWPCEVAIISVRLGALYIVCAPRLVLDQY